MSGPLERVAHINIAGVNHSIGLVSLCVHTHLQDLSVSATGSTTKVRDNLSDTVRHRRCSELRALGLRRSRSQGPSPPGLHWTPRGPSSSAAVAVASVASLMRPQGLCYGVASFCGAAGAGPLSLVSGPPVRVADQFVPSPGCVSKIAVLRIPGDATTPLQDEREEQEALSHSSSYWGCL